MIPWEVLLAEYGLEIQNSKIEPIENGLINSTWRVVSGGQEFILQKVNHSVFRKPQAIAYNTRLIADYLLKHAPDYLFISPIKTKRGEEMVHIDGGFFRLFPFVKNSHTIHFAEYPEQAFEAAKKFGEFTRLLEDFPIEKLQTTLPDFHNLSLRFLQFEEALKSGNQARLQQSKELIRFIKENKSIVGTYESILHNLSFKLRVTHHDTKISNILFDPLGKALCVIDLDTVMPGHFISDMGDMMRTYLSPANEEEKDFSKIEIRSEFLKAIRDGYMAGMQNGLSKEEQSHFLFSGKFMIYMQAIRFLTDYLNNDIYYGSKYEGHNFIRAGNQVVLLKKLTESA